ncbi:MAG: RraA family protein [Cyclobacteriaceae bacterium]|nr:RraA family protein [Cyclobacteriaceae bacterium]
MLSHTELLELQRWNTPTIYNGWEQITNRDPAKDAFNLEESIDFMPEMGPMAGYAVTVTIEPGNISHVKNKYDAWQAYREYIASVAGPKIVVVQDLDKPKCFGAFWGEVNSRIHRALGCIGTITDGSIRDLDEMKAAGFKALARRLSVGHAYSVPVEWNCDVEVFGTKISPGQLIHADKHGFLSIHSSEEGNLLDAARFMDSNECKTLIPAASSSSGKTHQEILDDLKAAGVEFSRQIIKKFNSKKGEW